MGSATVTVFPDSDEHLVEHGLAHEFRTPEVTLILVLIHVAVTTI